MPDGLLLNLVQSRWFRRLSRIRQLGLNNEVYPAAQHTRFQHSLGAYHLMCNALQSLAQKGVILLEREEEAAKAAILLHDVGHGPFSHVLEQALIPGMSHEQLSLLIMQQLNAGMGGALNLPIDIFKGNSPRHFLHELICSQLDVDRLDYLNRDSFFTGVREGNIGTARIIGMLDVADEHLVVESKGLYSVENYLVTRRLMYWQVYLHKTAVAAGILLSKALTRARHLLSLGHNVPATPALSFFLSPEMSAATFCKDKDNCLQQYAGLDDSDLWTTMKLWYHHPDRTLSVLARNFIDRNLFKVEVREVPPEAEELQRKREEIATALGVGTDEAESLAGYTAVEKMMYSREADDIRLIYPDGSIRAVPEVSDIIRNDNTRQTDRKFYFYYQRT